MSYDQNSRSIILRKTTEEDIGNYTVVCTLSDNHGAEVHHMIRVVVQSKPQDMVPANTNPHTFMDVPVLADAYGTL